MVSNDSGSESVSGSNNINIIDNNSNNINKDKDKKIISKESNETVITQRNSGNGK